jgi:hypothetical protein
VLEQRLREKTFRRRHDARLENSDRVVQNGPEFKIMTPRDKELSIRTGISGLAR